MILIGQHWAEYQVLYLAKWFLFGMLYLRNPTFSIDVFKRYLKTFICPVLTRRYSSALETLCLCAIKIDWLILITFCVHVFYCLYLCAESPMVWWQLQWFNFARDCVFLKTALFFLTSRQLMSVNNPVPVKKVVCRMSVTKMLSLEDVTCLNISARL